MELEILKTNLKKARADSLLSQAKLAQLSEVSVAAICQYEQGKIVPSLDKLYLIAKATNKPLCWFFMDEAEQEKWEKEAQLNSFQVEAFAQKSELEQNFALEALDLLKKYSK